MDRPRPFAGLASGEPLAGRDPVHGLRAERTLGPGAPVPKILDVLDEAGFPAIVATNCEQEYERYLRPGDRISATTVIESVSEEKRTALGPGHFITTLITYTDQS